MTAALHSEASAQACRAGKGHACAGQAPTEATGDLPAALAAKGGSCSSHASSRISSCSSGGSRRASASSASGLTQEEVEGLLAPGKQPPAQQGGSEAHPGGAAAIAPTPCPVQGSGSVDGSGLGTGQAFSPPAAPAAPQQMAPLQATAQLAAASLTEVGGAIGSSALRVTSPEGLADSDAVARVAKVVGAQQQDCASSARQHDASEGARACGSPKAAAKQSSFKEALGFLSDLRGRVLSPRSSANRAAAAAAAAASAVAAEEQRQQQQHAS